MTNQEPKPSQDEEQRREASEIWSPPLPPLHQRGLARPRIGIAGISIESSTFSPHVSGTEAFVMRRGRELVSWYHFLADGTELGDAAAWTGLTHGRSLPGGAVDPVVYRAMRDEIVAGITAAIADAGPFDGFFFDIHGAMSVVGMLDAEADLAVAVRGALGPDTLVSASMDLHGNVSRELVDELDLITCYRMAPHEDSWNTKERAVHNLLRQLRSEHGADPAARRPFLAWQQVPVLLPGEKTSTRIEPARGIYAEIPAIEAMPEVLDAAIWVGYAWADEPRCQAAVVVSGFDEAVVAAQAERLARRYWDARADFAFVAEALPLDAALDRALAEKRDERPFAISDSGDNPTAGGAGDVSWTLGELLARPELASGEFTAVHASIFDPAAVAQAVAVGIGAEVELFVGGRVDPNACGPVRLAGVVESIVDGDPVAGIQIVVRSGGIRAIVTERRKPFHHRADFTMLGIEPEEFDLLVVKIGYLEPELFELQRGWILGLTPGGVDQDLRRLGHANLAPGVYPFDDSGSPELRPTVLRR